MCWVYRSVGWRRFSSQKQQYRDAIEKLIADFRASGPIETRQRKYRSVLLGHGWCTEVHRLAEATLHLVDHGLAHEALILLRTMFETTVSLHWLSQKGDAGALGVFAEGGRVNRAAANDMQTAFNVPQDLIDQINSEAVEKTDESEVFRRFQAQCDEIDPRRQLYTVYRYLCGYAHPSSASAFAYIQEAGADSDPSGNQPEVWLRLMVRLWCATCPTGSDNKEPPGR
ncbi:DUF5677 domain-containing protein [Streptomyces sp. MK7]|uniref:DUF5677 domain-containing protein n=1 Tax=Streptomyces sp. MK7 TaxID=3067635 RepID=UPI00292CD78B|nr:DUF5677 domain-containing protein [Streptomyces sp. MK7]